MTQRFSPLGLLAGLVRRTWLVVAVTIVTCAAFAARAATALVDANYLIPGLAVAPHPGPPVQPVRPHAAPERGPLVGNLFCSWCAPAGMAGPIGTLQPAVLIATDLGGDARATVRVLGTEVQGSWGVGDAIPGLGQVDQIGPMWIEVVDGAGHRGRLSLLDAAAGGDPGTAMPRPPAAQRWAGRLVKLGEEDYEVDRGLVRELVTAGGQPGGLRMVPIFDHGEIKGVRLFAVAADSIPFALGLKTGDVLTAIDGAPLKKLEQLLDLYARLDQVSAVELSGTRAGKPWTRTLRLR